MSDIFKVQYLEQFNNFVSQLRVIFPTEDVKNILDKIESFSDEVKITRGQLFSSSIRDENFDLFLKDKIKVFSHKSEDTQTISESLFGADFCLKNLINNQPEEVKKIIWTNLHTLCLISELLKPVELQDPSRIKKLNSQIYQERGMKELETITEEPDKSQSESGSKKKLHDMLGVSVNNETTEMIDDIVKSFENILKNSNGGNPISSIMEISQKISVKYADKINNGEIELDKLMQSISKKVPGMEQMMSGMMGSDKKSKPKEKVVIDENFSTASVQVGKQNDDKKNGGLNIGNMLKMADQFGVLPGGNSQSQSGDVPNMPNIPGLGKVMELMQKLDSTNTKEEADALKQEMDSFLSKELGVDVDKLNAQLDTVTNQMNQKLNEEEKPKDS